MFLLPTPGVSETHGEARILNFLGQEFSVGYKRFNGGIGIAALLSTKLINLIVGF